MRILGAALTLLLPWLALAAPASAKDLCFHDDVAPTAFVVLKKVKLPRKAYDAAPVAGVQTNGDGVAGTIFRDAAGTLSFHLTNGGPCFVEVVIDDESNMSGPATARCADAVVESTWRQVDCVEAELPPVM